jgi:hypothetical protein
VSSVNKSSACETPLFSWRKEGCFFERSDSDPRTSHAQKGEGSEMDVTVFCYDEAPQIQLTRLDDGSSVVLKINEGGNTIDLFIKPPDLKLMVNRILDEMAKLPQIPWSDRLPRIPALNANDNAVLQLCDTVSTLDSNPELAGEYQDFIE